MIAGEITTIDVLLHMPTVVQGFGWAVLFRALAAIVSRRRTTFLTLVAEVGCG